ncbi:hypothetical protein [Streptomyces sp. 130]|uniref:hypothetical protein n=1 Tax=Streptomyces sp. 130 TaxID=2591006 RepID=UPI0021B0F682|nr:hypothetical protein [Streptomyces sp. 130]
MLGCRLLLREHNQWESGPDRILARGLPYALPGGDPQRRRDGETELILKPVTAAVDQLLPWYAAQLAA